MCSCNSALTARFRGRGAAFGDGAQQRLILLHPVDLRERAPARLAVVDQRGDVLSVFTSVSSSVRPHSGASEWIDASGRPCADRRVGETGNEV